MTNDYSIEDAFRATCKHDAGVWIVEDMEICPICGDTVGYTWEHQPIQTGTSSTTTYVFVRTQ